MRARFVTWIRAWAVLAVVLAAPACLAVESPTIVGVEAMAEVASYAKQGQEMGFRMDLRLAIGDTGGTVGGRLRCRAGLLPCPARTGTLTSDRYRYVPVSPAGWLFQMKWTVDFGTGGTCALDGLMPMRLSQVGPGWRRPLVFVGSYTCSRDGVEFDHGHFDVWQVSRARLLRPGHSSHS